MRETVRVATVDETTTDDESSNNNTIPPESNNNSESNTTYNLMTDALDPDIITPSYVPFHWKNEHWGDPC